jgi:tetratricopeptide (TPR) repeat protein
VGLIKNVPFTSTLHSKLDDKIATAQHAVLGDHLHKVVEELRFLDSVEPSSPERLKSIVSGCGSVWQERVRILQAAESVDNHRVLERVRRDLLDLAILWSDLRVRLAEPTQVRAEREQALQILSDAERMMGSTVVLDHEHHVHAVALGKADLAEEPEIIIDDPSLMPWDCFSLGRSRLREGDAKGAIEYLEAAISREPEAFWPHFYRGVCAYRLGEFDRAFTEFSVCVALAPEHPECGENRELARQAIENQRR